MSRSIWKGPNIDRSVWKNIKKVTSLSNISESQKSDTLKSKVSPSPKVTGAATSCLKVWNRRSMITPELIDTKCEIYTGNKWVGTSINEDRIGHLFGEFAPTKKIAQYKRKAKAKKKK